MNDITNEFLVESYENLDRVGRDLAELEKTRSNETLDSMFRAVQTIRETSGFIGLSNLESVTRAGENLLYFLRDGRLQITQVIADALLAMVDAIREMLANLGANGTEGGRDNAALIETLRRLQLGETFGGVADVAGSEEPKKNRRRKKLPSVSVNRAGPSEEVPPQSYKEHETDVCETALPTQEGSNPKNGLVSMEGAELSQEKAQPTPAVSDSTVRVDVGLLDKLMNLVGELVLSRNQVMQFAASQEDASFSVTSQHLNLVTSELQEGVMKTRMQPIGNVWNKFPRLVRDLAVACGKQVHLEMEGAETELDRTIIEAIKDPLTHVVRNSVDHGIESTAIRLAASKPAEGRLLLRAFHEGGQVNIEITDDGGGIDPDKVRDKAVQRGMITADQAAHMGERELINLIFLPGFSTAEKVTNVSGRGVGMDVVKTNVEKIGGTVDVQSKLGEGTTLKIKIPLTLAIIPALMVSAGGDHYAIPQVSLLELVRLEGEQARKGVEMVHDASVYRLRGHLLPLVYLNRELKLSAKNETGTNVNIVVLQADGCQFGLVVDGINDSKDIVVKPLGKHLKGLSTFSGATILGDGKVALILDVIGISQGASIVSEMQKRTLNNIAIAARPTLGERQALLICRYNNQDRVGIPLPLVARLEQFSLSTIERSDTHEVVQYRGEIMPLIRLARALNESSYDEENKGMIEVVVYREREKSVGLVVDQITDIVEERIAFKLNSHDSHLLGTAVINGKVTDILNIRSIIGSIDASYLGQPELA